ncbi:MAG: Cytochrome c [Candidatus Methanoperedens nitroreducens]|uniref:Cytochrome c n=1 Tax=Candidatus Methanoperedens nitratireducens TaxID=1392998 RepID=A0A0N8KR89_9EURY|nr:c-type cytochrome [Candidatus Methanoperedens sp. BLZ2]KAB2946974.1 MAG: c-type cytochrome [Candidatus Methanoperedens sp.]KPQ44266.1 MAG: Cytochrome c [Candidatus Methanoperedens sp. BLZ1]MBZ0176776.1 c-type cytochrome [Candidatus Methanoperedens nitroreducens]MCX9080498.1 c-type cytochrome [Candidatus Methanoperedens sp.]
MLTVRNFFNYVGKVSKLLLLLLAMIGLIHPSVASNLNEKAMKGEDIYTDKCISCHSIGGGKKIGPDLKDVTSLRNRDWLVRYISEPDKVLADKDPIAIKLLEEYNNIPMPNMGLSEAEADDVVAYLEAVGGIQATQPSITPAQAVPSPVETLTGDAKTGSALFTGSIPFKNGGSSCIACHNIAGIMEGGTLGPDLTLSYSKYGEAGIASVLASVPFPTMSPIYSNRPLTLQEQADLKAFLQQSAPEQPKQALIMIVVFSLIGMVGLLLLSHIIWRHRLSNVRDSLKYR